MQTNPYGAHEIIELHEVLQNAIDNINTLQLYFPFVGEVELRQMLHAHILFAHDEYNNLVTMVHGLGAGAAIPYRVRNQMATGLGMNSPQTPIQPNQGAFQMDERDVSSAVLGAYKASAKLKLNAALESANLPIRNFLLQSVNNCVNLAHEVWTYMYRRGYYPLATLEPMAGAQLLRGYQPMQTSGLMQFGYQTQFTGGAQHVPVYSEGNAEAGLTYPYAETNNLNQQSGSTTAPQQSDVSRTETPMDAAQNEPPAVRKKGSRSSSPQ